MAKVIIPEEFVIETHEDIVGIPEGFQIETIDDTTNNIVNEPDVLGSILSKATSISQAPSPLEVATSKTINQIKNIINSGLFGIPAKISEEHFRPRGLTKAEEFQGSLIGGEIIGGAIINKALSGIKKVYSIPAVRENKVIGKAIGMFKKLAKPSRKIKTGKQLAMADEKIAMGLDAVHKNRDIIQFGDEIGRLPSNIEESISAVKQTKDSVRQKWTAMRNMAGEDATIDMARVARDTLLDLRTKSKDIASPEVIEFATKKANDLAKRGNVSLEVAEQAIKEFNDKLATFYKSTAPGLDDISRSHVNAKIANKMRKSVDNTIMKSVSKAKPLKGKTYQDLKNTYGSLVEIEENLVKVAEKIAKNPNVPTAQAFDTVPILYGAFTGNAPLFAAGVSQKVLKETLKKAGDPNVLIRNTFSILDKSTTPTLLQRAIDLPAKGIAATVIRRRNEDE